MMQKGFAVVIALLIVSAWQYRNNRPVFFVLVGTLFAAAGVLVSTSNFSPRILESLAFAWLACMLVACMFGVGELIDHFRKKNKPIALNGGKEHKG
jgi:hypothetical protein